MHLLLFAHKQVSELILYLLRSLKSYVLSNLPPGFKTLRRIHWLGMRLRLANDHASHPTDELSIEPVRCEPIFIPFFVNERCFDLFFLFLLIQVPFASQVLPIQF